jgi:hypothetical protein
LGIPVGDTTLLRQRGGPLDVGYGQRMTQLLDANGDGLTDIVQVVDGRLHLYLRKGKKPDVILHIRTRPQSPAVTFEYEPVRTLAGYTQGTCTYPQACSTPGLLIVSRHSVEDGKGGLNSWRYSYTEDRRDLKGWGWLGFWPDNHNGRADWGHDYSDNGQQYDRTR